MAGLALRDTVKSYGVKIVDSVYHASVYSVIAYSALLILLAIVGMAVFFRVIEVPEFHPR
jgi:hypothetical protein